MTVLWLHHAEPLHLIRCLVLYIRQGIAEEGLGEEKYAAYKLGGEMPEAIEFTDEDSPKELEMKQLILEMTSYEPKDRPSAKDVFYQAYAIYIKKDPKQKVHCLSLSLK